MAEIKIRLRLGPSSADQRELNISDEKIVGDLITYWKKDYRLAEQDAQGELIPYALYRDHGSHKERIDPKRTLRSLRMQAFEELYLADTRQPWCQGQKPTTQPLKEPKTSNPVPPPDPITRPAFGPCSIEIAPGCVHQIGEKGLVLNREYLLKELPKSVVARERALTMLGIESRLGAVSRGEPGHCSIIWRQNWYLIAHHQIYISGTKYTRNEAVQINQTTTLLLGREGWPITIRLHSTIIAR
ncbi:hypothetical protein EYB53_016415 [Candidatus Chloroploca sp. M-50]|uniref:Uncharacterized protein n=1 Tax=Candidatus Chloroploca mongolica TaxID=2528176 RepID=A0ABS4DCX9_9CHLR|nr:hypothetical protein [Candidatus Chloroploca mongolica]MBP1467298.1 hypothetical protein [Candidatus Chloroploca mongolica]